MVVRFISTVTLLTLFFLTACSTIPQTMNDATNLPPILAQDEVLKPFVKIGKIEITREVYVTDYSLEPNLQEWAHTSLRLEASKLHADALIFPEVTSRQLNILFFAAFPATEYKASAIAIKFTGAP